MGQASYTKDFSDATLNFNKFKDFVLEKIRGDIIDIETHDKSLAKLFDMYSGIDAINVYNGQIRGLAIRIQYGNNWNTFTIRYKRATNSKTEYEKRIEAIYGDNGFLYPYITIQMYLTNKNILENKILSIGIVKTKDLYDYIKENFNTIKHNKAPDGNDFLIVSFNELKNNNKKIIIKNFNQ